MKKICVVTGTRAEYGLLKPLLKRLYQNPLIELELVITGAHLNTQFGRTLGEIQTEFESSILLEIAVDGTNQQSVADSTAQAISLFMQYLSKHKPDCVVVLGDRYEIMGVCTAATIHSTPMAHIHGGEVTQGAMDDAFRNAVSQMAQWHFPAGDKFAERLKSMGIPEQQIRVSGALGIENIHQESLLSESQVKQALSIDEKKPYLLITFHSETRSKLEAREQIDCVLKGLEPHLKAYYLIFTYANCDQGGNIINQRIEAFVDQHSGDCRVFPSLGALKYLSSVKYATAVVGNSSSGIIEAPALKTLTLDVGERQKGRMSGDSIMHCGLNPHEISSAISALAAPKVLNFQTDYAFDANHLPSSIIEHTLVEVI